MMDVVSYSQNLWLERMFFCLEQWILSLNFGIFLEIVPNIFKRMFALLYVKNEIKNFSKTVHNFAIENAIYGKLRLVKDWKYAPYFKMLDFRVFAFFQKYKWNIPFHFLWQVFGTTPLDCLFNLARYEAAWNFNRRVLKYRMNHWNKFKEKISLFIKHKLFYSDQG